MTIPQDLSQYPARFDDFAGAEMAKQQLQLAIRSAKARKAPLDHVLLTAPAGQGKTALAILVASEMTKSRRDATWNLIQPPLTWQQFVMHLDEMSDGDVLIIDEVHRIVEGGRKNAEFLLGYLNEGGVYTGRGFTPMPKVTIIAATTDPDKLPPAVTSRFPIQPVLPPYSPDEAAAIAKVTARSVLAGLPQPSADNLRTVASAANYNPRAMRRLLITLRDLVVTGNLDHDRGYDMDSVLAMADVTDDGLDSTARQYLQLMMDEFGGRAGSRALGGRMGVPLDDTERVLLERGLITRTSNGRELSVAGVRRVKQLKEAA